MHDISDKRSFSVSGAPKTEKERCVKPLLASAQRERGSGPTRRGIGPLQGPGKRRLMRPFAASPHAWRFLLTSSAPPLIIKKLPVGPGGYGGINMEPQQNRDYLACEKLSTFQILMFAGGFFGAFTYSIRGGVFCNAQTANFVLSAIALGNGQWGRFFYYLIPMSAYFLGAFISESVPNYIRFHLHIRWDTLLILLEMAAVLFLGLLPETAPYQISQITINLIASMQYNTFRQAQRIPMATTFCTNHLRQTGALASRAIRHHDREAARRMVSHFRMLLSFVLGGVAAAVLCRYFLGKALLFTLLPLGYLLAKFLLEDIRAGKDLLARKPAGH